MNLGTKSTNEILFMNFNQDYSCISVGTRNGYKIYNCDPFGKCYSREDHGVGLVEMLYCTSLIAVVGSGDHPSSSPRRLQLINTKRQSTICELTFPTTILAVKMNRNRLIVVIEEQIYLHDIQNMKLLHTIETSPNPAAVCAMSPGPGGCYIAYPSPTGSAVGTYTTTAGNSSPDASAGAAGYHSQTSGDVMIFDALSCQVVNVIQAHKRPVSCMAISPDSTMIATASDKGTVIRVFSLPDGKKLHQFRRGSYPARIFSISFNATSTLLCVSSDTETVHIFRLDNGSGSEPPLSPRSLGRPHSIGRSHSAATGVFRRSSLQAFMSSRLVGSVGSYLPEALTEIWEPSRDFAFLKLPATGIQSLVALSASTPQVTVITAEGYFYQYSIDLEQGGECVLLKQYSLLDVGDTMGTYMT
ncbi:WD40-repeat-containing domain protein [Dimargaris cristalligena]|uniref:Autophagy-related protein 18 n=1 Tax=Dimargaris cristalligena TaxID=215637 RepID=A0A4Q0A1V8_9FUNG|nr:WD40-repeat-containing domain protein [Dimargaris cristalligena]|eukprot:RKP40075.1 WD40-repeat-containing domain protein [Dimargaris cristalligena]